MGVIQGISRSIINPVPGRVVSTLDSIQKRTIAAAFRSLDFNPSHADAFASWYIGRNASLSGVVQDETPNRDHSRDELTNRATSFTTNQRFVADSIVTSTGKTALSVAGWFKTTDSGIIAIASEYLTSGNDRSWMVRMESGRLSVTLSSDGTYTSTTAKTALTDRSDLNDGVWKHFSITWDGPTNELFVFVDGKIESTTPVVSRDYAITVLNNTSHPLQIAAWDAGLGIFEGEIAHPAIWESSLTAAQVRDLYLDNLANVPTPDHAWILDGDKAWTIAGSSTLSPSNSPTRSESEDNPKSSNDFNHAGWSNYENLMYPSEDFGSGTGWSPANACVRNDDGSFYFATTASRLQNNNGPTFTSGTTYTITVTFSTEDVGKSVKLTINDGSWAGSFVVIDSSGVATATKTMGANGTFYGITTNNDETLTPLKFQIYETVNEASYIETTVATKPYTGIVPAQWGSNTLDANGNPLQYTGQVARNGQLEDGPCADLNGTNQYGVITNSDDYSDEDWVLSGYCVSDLAGNRFSVSQQDGTGTGRAWIGQIATTDLWVTFIGGSSISFTNISAIVIGRTYQFTLVHDATANTVSLTVDDLTSGITETETLSSVTMESATGDFIFGASKALVSLWDGKIWGLSLDCTSDPDKSFNCPISEQVGSKSYDISGNGKDIAWQNTPSLSGTQNSFFHGEHYGCNSVPIFVDGVELYRNASVNYDGLKTAVVELDFFHASDTAQTLFTNGSVTPFWIRTISGGAFDIRCRNSANAIVANTTGSFLVVGETYQLKIEIVEDEDNPTTESYGIVSDRITGEILATTTGRDIDLATSSNSGLPQIGSYTNATGSFLGDIYRVRHIAGGVEKMLWTSDNYLVNQTDDSAMTETGGTLEVKKIPAKEDGSQTDANGYPIQNTGPSHKNTQATLRGYLANSDSEADIYFGASFNGTLDANINADTAITGFPFSIACDVKMKSSVIATIASVSVNTGVYFGFSSTATLRKLNVIRRSGGSQISSLSSFIFTVDQWHSVVVTYLSETSVSVEFDGVSETLSGLTSVTFTLPATTDDLWIGQLRSSLGESPNFEIKNVIVKQGSTIVNDMPLYKDALDRSSNCNHGTDTDVTYLNNPATEIAALNPTIAGTETLAVTDGNKKLILLGQK